MYLNGHVTLWVKSRYGNLPPCHVYWSLVEWKLRYELFNLIFKPRGLKTMWLYE